MGGDLSSTPGGALQVVEDTGTVLLTGSVDQGCHRNPVNNEEYFQNEGNDWIQKNQRHGSDSLAGHLGTEQVGWHGLQDTQSLFFDAGMHWRQVNGGHGKCRQQK